MIGLINSVTLHVEVHRIGVTVRSDGKVHYPPAAHLELHALDKIISVAEILCDLWTSRKAVTMFRHVSIYSDRSIFNKLAISSLDVQSPLVHLVNGDNTFGTCIRDEKQAIF